MDTVTDVADITIDEPENASSECHAD